MDNCNKGIGEVGMGKSCRRHGYERGGGGGGGGEQGVRRMIFVTEQRAFSE